MSEIEEKIAVTDELLSEIEKAEVEYDTLGEQSGFHEANASKIGICDYARNLLERIEKNCDAMNDVVVLEHVTKFEKILNQVKSTVLSIQKLVDGGVHNQQFPSQRKTQTTSMGNHLKSLKKEMHPLENDLKLSELHTKVDDADYFAQAKLSAEEYEEQARKSAEAIEKLNKNAQKQTVQSGIEESAGQFDDLYKHHEHYEGNWLNAVAASAVLLCGAVIFVLLFNPEPPKDSSNLYHAIQLFKRAFLVSIPAVFLRLSLTKYNTE